MNRELREQILNCLNLHGQAVTYGALAELVNTTPLEVMDDLPRNHHNSWVINADSRRPTGYVDEQIDPRFLAGNAGNNVIGTSEELQLWLDEKKTSDRAEKTGE